MAQKTVLGKGLASLLPGAAGNSSPVWSPVMGAPDGVVLTPLADSNRDRHPGIAIASLDEIRVNPYQPRREFSEAEIKELAQSIQANGIIQPLVVRKDPSGSGYQLIAGERRLRASRLAGLKQVPIVVRKTTDREALEIALVENIQRENLNCIDEALAYFQLMQDFSITQEEVSQRVGKDRATVANHLRLLRLPEAIIDDLKKGYISFGHGKALLSLEDQDNRLTVRAQIIEKKLSVRQTEQLIEQIKKGEPSSASNPREDASLTPIQQRLASLSQELGRTLSTRVIVKGNSKRGRIQIHYHTATELERILDHLKGSTT